MRPDDDEPAIVVMLCCWKYADGRYCRHKASYMLTPSFGGHLDDLFCGRHAEPALARAIRRGKQWDTENGE